MNRKVASPSSCKHVKSGDFNSSPLLTLGGNENFIYRDRTRQNIVNASLLRRRAKKACSIFYGDPPAASNLEDTRIGEATQDK